MFRQPQSGLPIRLMQATLGRNADGISRQLPADVGQPEGADAERAQIIQGMVTVQHRLRRQLGKLGVADVERPFLVGPMQSRHGQDGSGKHRRGIPRRREVLMHQCNSVPQISVQHLVKVVEQFLRLVDTDHSLGYEVRDERSV